MRLLLAFLLAGTLAPLALAAMARASGVRFERFPAWLLREYRAGVGKRIVPYFALWAVGVLLAWLGSARLAADGGLVAGPLAREALVGLATGLVVGAGLAILLLVPRRVPSKARNRRSADLRSAEPDLQAWAAKVRLRLLLLGLVWLVAFGLLGAAFWLETSFGLLAFLPPFVLLTVGLVACGNPDVDDWGTARLVPLWLLAAGAASVLAAALVVGWREPSFFPRIGYPAALAAYVTGAALAGTQMLHARNPARGPKIPG